MRKGKIILAMILLSFTAKAQLNVQSNPSNIQLSGQIQGAGVTITNIIRNCDTSALGTFQGSSELPLASGLVLSTGNAADISGSSSQPPVNTCFQSNCVCQWNELYQWDTTNSYDFERVTIDVVPAGDSLIFNHCFASDEYPAMRNDVSGIFLSGPNPAGGQYDSIHISGLPPGYQTPLCVFWVSPLVNQAYYVDNPNSQYFKYRGMTVLFRRAIHVTPGQTYSILCSIADAGDCNYDSGLFLGSLSSVPTVTGITELDNTLQHAHQYKIYDLTGRLVQTGTEYSYAEILKTLKSNIYIVQEMDGLQPVRIFKVVIVKP